MVEVKQEKIATLVCIMAAETSKMAAELSEITKGRMVAIIVPCQDCLAKVESRSEPSWPPLFHELRSCLQSIQRSILEIRETINSTEI